MIPISELFDITYGTKLDFNKCTTCGKDEGVNYVSRSNKNCGVTARVFEVENKTPFEAGLITVAMGGSMLASFVQQEPFYTAQNIKVLRPKKTMTTEKKLYYCLCIEANKHKFSTFGREANYTFDSLLVPDTDEMPDYLSNYNSNTMPFTQKPLGGVLELKTANWKWFTVSDLFHVYTSKENNAQNRSYGETPYISSTKYSNGISRYVSDKPTVSANTITVARNGSVGSAFYQPVPYCASPDDIRIFEPKFGMNKYIGLFLTVILESEKYRYAYGRKFGTKRMNQTKIKLPADSSGTPDWAYMENYIKSLPYSGEI
jgi:restriction endonuclease S subunit